MSHNHIHYHKNTFVTVNEEIEKVESYLRSIKNLSQHLDSEMINKDEQEDSWALKLTHLDMEDFYIKSLASPKKRNLFLKLGCHSVEDGEVGKLNIILKEASGDKGTEIQCLGSFNLKTFTTVLQPDFVAKMKIDNFMHTYLSQIKQILETGEIATIKGQPRGNLDNKNAPQERVPHVVHSHGEVSI